MTDDRAEWRAWRREGITATDVAKVASGKYGGLWSVLSEKRGEEVVFDDAQLDRMQRGKDLEPVVARMVELGTGLHVGGEETWCEHQGYPERRCTVDGFLLADPGDDLEDAKALLEQKTYDSEVWPAWDYYRAQVEWQLHVTGFDLAVLAAAAYDAENDICHGPRIELIRPDPLMLSVLLDAADLITRHLEDGTWPDPDGSEEAAAIIARLHPTPVDVDVVDLSDLADDLAEYAEIKALTSKGGRMDLLSQRIKVAIGDGAVGIGGRIEARWGAPAQQLDEAALLAAHPEFGEPVVVLDKAQAKEVLGEKGLNEFKRPTGSRRLTIKELED